MQKLKINEFPKNDFNTIKFQNTGFYRAKIQFTVTNLIIQTSSKKRLKIRIRDIKFKFFKLLCQKFPTLSDRINYYFEDIKIGEVSISKGGSNKCIFKCKGNFCTAGTALTNLIHANEDVNLQFFTLKI